MRNPLLTLALLVLCLWSAAPARATTIVVARTANEIVIGADSKVADAYSDAVNRSACNILQVDNLFIAMEGLEVDRQTGFSIPELATTALRTEPDASAAEKACILTGVLVSRSFPHQDRYFEIFIQI